MNTYQLGHAAGLAVGIAFGLVVTVIILRCLNTNHKAKTDYDEMQQLLRNRGYKYGFYSVLIVEALLCVVATAVEIPAEPLVVHFLPIFIGVLVQSSYCIWKGAYVGLNTNTRRYAVFAAVVALLNLFPFVMAARSGELVADGRLQSPFVNLLCAVMLAVLGLVLLLRKAADRGVEE